MSERMSDNEYDTYYHHDYYSRLILELIHLLGFNFSFLVNIVIVRLLGRIVRTLRRGQCGIHLATDLSITRLQRK